MLQTHQKLPQLIFMAHLRHLDKAPIKEALIDFRTKLPDKFKIEQFEPIKEQIKETYPVFEKQYLYKSKHEFEKGKLVKSPFVEDMGIRGYVFKSSDEIKIAQFRLDGFTFNRLSPYTHWDDVIQEAKRLWQFFKNIASPEVITRLAVRYINHLRIPLPIDDFGDFLTVPPSVPEGLPQAVQNFLIRTVIVNEDAGIKANITQALDEKGSDSQNLNIILDIDTFKMVHLNSDKEDIWNDFESLRNMKNDIFFKYITEQTARLFE